MVDGEEEQGTHSGDGQVGLFHAREEGGPSPGQGSDGETPQRNSEEGSGETLGYVYFIETEDRRFIKIGFSFKVVQRLSHLGTIMPIRLLGCFPGSMATERWLHAKFAGDRQQGEWFKSSDELRNFITFMAPPIATAPPIAERKIAKKRTIPVKDVAVKDVAMAAKKNSAAVELGRRGGLAKVPKGFAMMDPKRRAEIAKKSAAKRWGKKKKAKA